MNWLKKLFRKLTPLEVASAELMVAELAKLEAETAKEFAAALVGYNNDRISRLKRYIGMLTKEDGK